MDPWLIGLEHERSAAPEQRSSRGAWYTPKELVLGLVAMALDQIPGRSPERILDPACGGGAFLLAALDCLVDSGVAPDEALSRVRGSDIDAGAVEASRRSLAAWAEGHGAPTRDLDRVVRQLDALTGCAWDQAPDLVVGNPPFASPLRSGSLSAGAINQEAVDYQVANKDQLGPYSDLAARHLHRCLELVEPGGLVLLILPHSTLAARDSATLRSWAGEMSSVEAVWATQERVFEAGVRVWAPALRPGGTGEGVAVYAGVSPTYQTRVKPAPWNELVAKALGAPDSAMTVGGKTLGSIATATAGFRDEYYGLAAACRESTGQSDLPRLATVGSIDPLNFTWGAEPIRFASKKWERPVIDLSRLEGKVGRWAEARLVPKVLVATQTKILEPYLDRSGRCLPSTPLIAIHADESDLDRIAALLLAPPVVLWCYTRWFGAALSGDAIKASAAGLLEIPLPANESAWGKAAHLVESGNVVEVARTMNRAFGGNTETWQWWLDRSGLGESG